MLESLIQEVEGFRAEYLKLGGKEDSLHELLYLITHDDLLSLPYKRYQNLGQFRFVHRREEQLSEKFNQLLLTIYNAAKIPLPVREHCLELIIRKDWQFCEDLKKFNSQAIGTEWLTILTAALKKQIPGDSNWKSDLLDGEAVALYRQMVNIYFHSLFTDEENEQAEVIIACFHQLQVILLIDTLLTDYIRNQIPIGDLKKFVREMINPLRHQINTMPLLHHYLGHSYRFHQYLSELVQEYGISRPWRLVVASWMAKIVTWLSTIKSLFSQIPTILSSMMPSSTQETQPTSAPVEDLHDEWLGQLEQCLSKQNQKESPAWDDYLHLNDNSQKLHEMQQVNTENAADCLRQINVICHIDRFLRMYALEQRQGTEPASEQWARAEVIRGLILQELKTQGDHRLIHHYIKHSDKFSSCFPHLAKFDSEKWVSSIATMGAMFAANPTKSTADEPSEEIQLDESNVKSIFIPSEEIEVVGHLPPSTMSSCFN